MADSRPLYSPYLHYQNEAETRKALDLISPIIPAGTSQAFSEPLRGALADPRRRLYASGGPDVLLKADDALCDLYRKPDEWARKRTLNIAGSGKFSSDRTIQQCADEIWGATPRPVA